MFEYDLFISHAGEDEESVARPLAEELRDRGYSVWYDELSLNVGDSLRRSIDRGLANSRFGVVILSPAFFGKEWPQKELDGLTARESGGIRVILPVWHNVVHTDVLAFSPMLADRVAAHTSKGLQHVVESLARAMAPLLGRSPASTDSPDGGSGAQRFAIEMPGPRRSGEMDGGRAYFEIPRLVITNRSAEDAVLNIALRVRVADTAYYATEEHRLRVCARDFAECSLRFEMSEGNVNKAGGFLGLASGRQYLRLRDLISGREERHYL